MFEDVTKRQTGKYAARRAGWVFGSTAFQLGLVAMALFAGQKIKAAIEEKPIDVKFVRAAPPPRPPPPPAAAPPRRKDNAPKPPDTKAPPPPPPQALIQPKDVQAEMKVDTSPKEPEYNYGNTGEGVIGGVVGAQPSIEDAPTYATAGYKKPSMAEPGCVQRSVRVTEDIIDAAGNAPVTVKFSINREGTPGRFEIMSANKDHRIANAIWTAITACKWKPGADAQGRATNIWVIMPIRFTQ